MYERFATALDYFCGDQLAADVFLNKQALRDQEGRLIEKTPDAMHYRLAKELAEVEAGKFRKPYTLSEIFEAFKDFGEIIPQGSPMFAIGNPYQICSASNCFVVPSPIDSYGGIFETDEQLAQICKRRGGVGCDLSNLRPAGTPTANAGKSSSGVVSFMERFSRTIREVGQYGRRGALMLTISVRHPQVLDFARAKIDRTRVTGANVSVRITDDFMRAVEDDHTFELQWPVDSTTPVTTKIVSARQIWNELNHCAWDCAEPGLLFWDTILQESPADCYASDGFLTISVNPCAELPLSALDSCRLLLLNTFGFVRNPFLHDSSIDWPKFRSRAYMAQRLMDDIVDLELRYINRIIKKIENDPEPEETKERELRLWREIYHACHRGRRTGTGLTGVGDALASKNVSYGSSAGVALVEKFYQELKLSCYRASVDMAEEIGPFPVWNHEKEKENPYLLRIRDEDPELWERMKKYGRRNIALLTTPPAGTTSIVAGPRPYFQRTSGAEPLFRQSFKRRRKVNPTDEDQRVDFVDSVGDSWQEYIVHHSGVQMWMDLNDRSDAENSPYAGSCAEELGWKHRLDVLEAAQKHVDHAISVTINLPNSATVEEVKTIYTEAWKKKIKGITVYRDGCRSGVLVDAESKQENKVQKTTAPKRPKELPCETHLVKVHGRVYFVVVGILGDDPYEVFVGLNRDKDDMYVPAKKKGMLRKLKRGVYSLVVENKTVVSDIASLAGEQEEAITRLVSTSLRHGADIAFIVHQLEKVSGNMQSFSKALSRVLKKYVKNGSIVPGENCPSCNSSELKRQEGCVTCMNCGWSKC